MSGWMSTISSMRLWEEIANAHVTKLIKIFILSKCHIMEESRIRIDPIKCLVFDHWPVQCHVRPGQCSHIYFVFRLCPELPSTEFYLLFMLQPANISNWSSRQILDKIQPAGPREKILRLSQTRRPFEPDSSIVVVSYIKHDGQRNIQLRNVIARNVLSQQVLLN